MSQRRLSNVETDLSPLEISNLLIERPSLLVHNPLLISNGLWKASNVRFSTVCLINWVSTTTCFILSNLACSSFSASFNSASFSLTLETQFLKSNSEDTTETIHQKSIINNTPRT